MNIYDYYARGCRGKINEHEDSPICNSQKYSKLHAFNWLDDIPEGGVNKDIIEIRFKNTRKGYFVNNNQLRIEKDDIVAVEASPGHDIGVVSLTGDLVLDQLKKSNIDPKETEFKKVYRKAKPVDIEKWYQAIELEHPTMIRSREIARSLKLDMKIGDVEYQGDKTKAIFYYIADERVDFRELIKVLAEEFRIRIEMKQIGARQEAGRIGGIGPCGRELCCATWINNFVSVTTNSARYQDIALNPQKLAGQCGKLKCCLNYELSCYLDALEDFPDSSVALETEKGTAYCQKRDIFRRIMWFTYEPESAVNMVPVSVSRVQEFIRINQEGGKIESLVDKDLVAEPDLDYENVVGKESLTRFDEEEKKSKKKKHKKNKKRKPGNDK